MTAAILLGMSMAYGSEVQTEVVGTSSLNDVTRYVSHGPEKPPPDDGYEFKGSGGGNGMGKIGLVMVVASAVTAVGVLRAESGSEERQTRQYATGGLLVGGVILLAIERAR